MNRKEEKHLYQGPNVFLRLLKYLALHPWYALTAVVMLVLSTFFNLIGPSLSGKAIDAIGFDMQTGTAAVDFDRVYNYCAQMLVFYLFSAVLTYLLTILMTRYSQLITRKLRREVYEKLLSLPIGYFDRLQAGDLISRLSYDINTINSHMAGDLRILVNSVLTIFLALGYMIAISPILLGVLLFTLPFSVLIALIRSKKIRPLFRKRSAMLGELNAYSEETLSGAATIRAYHREEKFSERYRIKNSDAAEAFYRANSSALTIGPSIMFINNITTALISVFGTILFLFGGITIGNISSFILYSKKFADPISELSSFISDIQSLRSASERVFAVIDELPEPDDDPEAISLGEVRGEVEFRHVKFSYVPEKEIIHDLNLLIPPGKTVAIVGPTGGGKTTIVNLLMRFYDVSEGEILLDGIPIKKIRREELRKTWTMVLQETWLMGGTIAENIAYGSDGATREEIEDAAKRADVHDFIMSLPLGYETRIEDGGTNISKGQKQLLTIARSMLSHAKMLILDEATSNVDTRTELRIEKAMLKLMEGRTCFVIAHRLSTIENADLILVVRDGDVVETGTHSDLIKKNGFYAELYHSQFS